MSDISVRSLTISYLTALVVIAAIAVLSNQIMHAGIREQAGFAALINEAGRQRMRSQRIASLISQHASGSPLARTDGEETIAQLETTHAALTASAMQRTQPGSSASVRALYFDGNDSIDRMVGTFVSAARRVFMAPAGSTGDQGDITKVLTLAREPLLQKLNEVVLAYEKQSDSSIRKLQRTENILLISVLLTLLFEALFVFRPMVRRLYLSFQSIFENASVGIAEVDNTGRLTLANAKLADIVGGSASTSDGRFRPELLLPADRDMSKLDEVRQGATDSYNFEARFNDERGVTKWCDVSVSALDADERPARSLIYVVRDISLEKSLAANRDMLIGELHHRLKNMITIIEGIVAKTISTAKSPEEFRKMLSARIQNISVSHDLLTEKDWQPLHLSEILSASTKGMFADFAPQVTWSGDDAALPSQQAVALSMIIHELITNAIKHGCLSGDDGSVLISTDLTQQPDAPPVLSLKWQERNGPVVTVPSSAGFGTFMIENGTRFSLNGTSAVEFAPDGLVVTLSFPLAQSVGMRTWSPRQ